MKKKSLLSLLLVCIYHNNALAIDSYCGPRMHHPDPLVVAEHAVTHTPAEAAMYARVWFVAQLTGYPTAFGPYTMPADGNPHGDGWYDSYGGSTIIAISSFATASGTQIIEPNDECIYSIPLP